jgi:hypothetical protein
MRIALATCRDLPDWEVDDAPLHRALVAHGVALSQPSWDAAGVDWGAFDAVLIRTTWDYWHRRADFVAWAEHVAVCSQLHNPAAVVRWNTDKRYLRQLSDCRVPIAPTVWLERGQAVDLGALVASRGWSRGFIKPVVGASASDTCRFSADDVVDAQAHLDALLLRQGAMVQPYLARVERDGERSAIFIDGAHSHSVEKRPVPGDYRVQDDYGATDHPCQLSGAELQAAATALAATERLLGLTAPLLYARVDFLCGDDGAVYLNELELVEPSLFFRHAPTAAEALADALLRRVAG